MFIMKFIWGVIINLDFLVILLLCLGGLRLACGKCCNIQPKVMALSALLLLFMLGDWPYSGRDILRRLENHFPANAITQDLQGMVVIGGSYCLLESEHVGKPVYHKTSGRIIEAMQLAHTHPHMRITFIGSALEGKLFEELMLKNGLAKERLEILTDENIHSLEAAVAHASAHVNDKQKKRILITSAYNMPRAMQVFHSEQWNVVAHPVDYHTMGHEFDKKPISFFKRLVASFMDRLGLLSWNIAWREIAGLVNLRLSGKTESIFPK